MKNILVAEDEPYLRLLYEIELAHAGYSVMTAANAAECLEYIRVMPIDLVILDIRMPGMDGIEVLQKIMAQHLGVPVVIHTAYTSYRDNYLTWGADAYLVKSSNLDELIATVDRLLHRENNRPTRRRLASRPTAQPMERIDHVGQTL